MRWVQLCGSLSLVWHCLSLELEWKLTFSSPVATAEFQICWHIECSTFTASSFRIWNSSTGIPLPSTTTKYHRRVVLTTETCFLTTPDARSLKSRCPQCLVRPFFLACKEQSSCSVSLPGLSSVNTHTVPLYHESVISLWPHITLIFPLKSCLQI